MGSSTIDTSSLTGQSGANTLGVIGDVAVAILKIVAASLVAS